MTQYMILRGAGEALNDNLPTRFLRPLLKHGDTVTQIDYPASIGPVTPAGGKMGSMDASRKAGKAALAAAVERTANIPVLVTYSLGGYAGADYLEALAVGEYPDHQIGGAIEIASPRARVANGREGLARAHRRYPDIPVCEVRNYWDIICNTPTNSPLMKMTGLVAIASGGVADGFNVMAWIMGEFLRQAALPSQSDIRLIQGYANGIDHAAAYLDNPVFRAHVSEWITAHRF
ncbi:lysin B [Gordonia phage Upyo]|nr:lysin B [Gordonia phage Upyo]